MVYFFGSDGTGKTTHADLVSLHLQLEGYRTCRVSIKQHHTLSFIFLKFLTRHEPQNQAINYFGFDGELGRKIKTPWKILEITSLLPALFNRVFLPLSLGYVVVCDRYLLDTLVTLSYFLKEPMMVSGNLAKLLIQLIPKNSLLVYFETDTRIILKRKQDEPLTKPLIEYYKNAYRTFAKWPGLSIIMMDTTAVSIQEVHAKILLMLQRNNDAPLHNSLRQD
jgi:thymidylate kinase